MNQFTDIAADARGPADAPVEPIHLGDFTATRRMVYLAIIAIVLGVIATYVAFALLQLIGLFTNVFYYQRLEFAPASPAGNTLGAASVVVPIAGALIIGLMARYGSERIRGHGIPEALEAILTRGSRVEPRVALLKPLSSAISIGSGGPFGAEGPIIMTGGAFGSLVAQLFKLTSAERKTLLVAGAAAGMSATFASPVAAILLAVELLLFEWKPRSFVPVALASATAAAARTFVIGPGPLFPLPAHPAFPGTAALACCALAGLVAGGFSALLTGAVYAFEDLFKRLPIHWMWWPAIGGLVIGLGGLLCPQALGVGYDVIGQVLHDSYTARAILVLVVVKGLIWSVSLGSGTSGGVLAPLLMMGGALGGLEGLVFPDAGVGFWPLVSMGAILGGTMRSPLTGVVFAVELTHDQNMLLPLVIAVTVAHAFTVLVLRRSILTEKVARRGFHVSREYAIDELEILFVRDVMTTDLAMLSARDTPAGALSRIAPEGHARHERSQHLYPVLDDDANLVGAAMYAEVHAWTTDPARRNQPLRALASADPPVVFAHETLRSAVGRMAERGLTALIAVNPANPRHVVGKIALHDLLKARARHLEDEQRRERILPFEYLLP
ncbi:MAG TPA: chloride channel protein, partial [Kofleriaceae bacterium]